MKHSILILLLFLNFLTSYCQNEDSEKQESYILTTNNEKIKIIPNEDITNIGDHRIQYYKKVFVWGKKKKIKGVGFLSNTSKTFGTINTYHIVKILDGERLYLPFTTADKKTRMFRYIAKNNKYILGTYEYKYLSGGAISNIRTYSHDYYVILDHKYNIIQHGEIYGKDKEKSKKNIEEIKKIFGQCLERDDHLADLVLSNDIEPDENLSIEELRFNNKYGHYVHQKFLYYKNQIECDSEKIIE